MRSKLDLLLVLLFCSASLLAAGQANNPNAPGPYKDSGSAVTGHVYLDDTKAPARKAQVYLEPTSLLLDDASANRTGNSANEPPTLSVQTRFDGSFAFAHVAPGSYYVIATAAGYISPYVQIQLAENRSFFVDSTPLDPDQKKAKARILRSLARIDVQSNLPASVDVVLERGAAVSGNISYDDSGPAAGLQVNVLARTNRGGKDIWIPVDFGSGPNWNPSARFSTDDRGNYRICGLPPGIYVIEAELRFDDLRGAISGNQSSAYGADPHPTKLLIYSGSTPHKKDSVSFAVQQAEERTGEEILIPISRLHTIKGNIVSARDGHVVKGGMLSLVNASDRSPVDRENLTQDDASFTFNLVFDGDYIVTADLSADVDYIPAPRAAGDHGPPQFNSQPRHFYGSASLAVHVDGDVDGLTITVPEPTPKEAQMFQDEMRRQQQQQPTATSDPQQPANP